MECPMAFSTCRSLCDVIIAPQPPIAIIISFLNPHFDTFAWPNLYRSNRLVSVVPIRKSNPQGCLWKRGGYTYMPTYIRTYVHIYKSIMDFCWNKRKKPIVGSSPILKFEKDPTPFRLFFCVHGSLSGIPCVTDHHLPLRNKSSIHGSNELKWGVNEKKKKKRLIIRRQLKTRVEN